LAAPAVIPFTKYFWNMQKIISAGTIEIIISIVPALIIFCMFQKYFVKGITAGAAKG